VPEGTTVEIDVAAGPTIVAVPSVVGLDAAQATQRLEGLNLIVRRVEAPSESVPAGVVISQSPSAGVDVKPGSTVEITVSTGQQQGTVPSVIGMNLTNAENTLIAAGLVLGNRSEEANAAPAGQVISQNPGAGSTAASGSAVGVVVSTGPAAATVPSVVNLSRADAEAQITNAGFTANAQETAVSDPAQDGIVISQNPASGSSRPAGSSVTIVVGRYTGNAG
jgi:serine/threonine-protein kinase